MTNRQITFREWVDGGMQGTFLFIHRSAVGTVRLLDEILEVNYPGIIGRYNPAHPERVLGAAPGLEAETIGYLDETGEAPAAADEEPTIPAAKEDS